MASRDFQATVEDHYSDDDERPAPPPPEALRKSPSANVAAKRSHHSDLGGEKPVSEPTVNIDLRSDSGYSTHTTATMSSSADSATSAKASSPPTAPSSAASYPTSSPPISRRRPTLVSNDRKPAIPGSPQKALQRSSSSASKRPGSTSRRSPPTEECREPNCTKCGPNAIPSRTRKIVREPPRLTPVESGVDLSFDQRSQRSDPAPASYTTPSSPRFTRQPPPYAQGSAMVLPAQTRRRSSSTSRPRPMSYHEGQQYWPNGVSAPYPSPPQDHGPPPAMSAHFNMQQQQHLMQYQQMNAYAPGMLPNGNYYHPNMPMGQASPPYEPQRPAISARGSSNATFSTRRPAAIGPTITYGRDDQPMPSARFHNAPQSARQERFPDVQVPEPESEEDYDSPYDDDEEEEEEVPPARYEQALVPHRKLKSRREKESRPPLQKAKTTQVYNERRQSLMGMSQSSTLPERPKERDPRASRALTAASSRAQSKVRPALVQQPKAQSAYETPRAGKVVVEDSRSRRSRSYQAYDANEDYDREYLAEQKRRNRNSKLYIDDGDYRASREDAIIVPERRRRDTATSVGRRSEYIVQDKPRQMAMDAEAYQQRSRGTNDPLADSVHKAAKRASRIPSNPSETGSNKSDDRKTRISQSARTTVTSGGPNGEIRLRVDASAPLSLQFNGDMEGRTLQINPAEDGMADIVIGSSRGEESVYRSEQGSRIGSRQSVAAGPTRRQFEEQSVRSSRSSQVRRDRESDRRPLRRRQTEYN